MLPFLPQDNKLLTDQYSEPAISAANEKLSFLLCLRPNEFWSAVRTETSLGKTIDSFLRFKRRVHDSCHRGDSNEPLHTYVEDSPAMKVLSKRIFMVLLRLVSPEPNIMDMMAEQASLITSYRLLDVPKLMDVAVLYGPANPEPCRKLMNQAFHLLPSLFNDTVMAGTALSINLMGLTTQICNLASTQQLASAHNADPSVFSSIKDALVYLYDVSLTLESLIICHTPAAAALLARLAENHHLKNAGQAHNAGGASSSSSSAGYYTSGGSNEQHAVPSLLPILASIYDVAIPAAAGVLKSASGSKSSASSVMHTFAERVSTRLLQLICQLIKAAYLEPLVSLDRTAAGPTSSSTAVNNSSAKDVHLLAVPSSAKSSQQTISVGSCHNSECHKTEGGLRLQVTAEQRGAEMMAALMSISETSSTTNVVPSTAASGGIAGSAGSRSVLCEINNAFGLDADVTIAMQKDIVQLDETQYEYLLALMGSSPGAVRLKLEERGVSMLPSSSSRAQPGTTSSTGALPGSSSSAADPVLVGLISQIRDMLPEFGTGFLTACLHHYDMKPEQVINHILEGSLHPDLKKLDPHAMSLPPSHAVTGMTHDAVQAQIPSSWSTAATQAANWHHSQQAAAAAGSRSVAVPTAPGLTKQRQPAVHRGLARVLGSLEPEVRAATRGRALELQWESDEDEYDDSFDGLQTSGADAGVCDIEGEDVVVNQRNRFRSSQPDLPTEPAEIGEEKEVGSGTGQRTAAGTGSGTAASRKQSSLRLSGDDLFSRARPGTSTVSGVGGAKDGTSARLSAISGPDRQQGAGRGRGAASAAGGRDGRGRGRGGRGTAGKLWVSSDGRIYNYAKEGSQQVDGREGAEHAVQAAKQAAKAIMGLGPGGNVPSAPSPAFTSRPVTAATNIQSSSSGRQGAVRSVAEAIHGTFSDAGGQQQQQQQQQQHARKGGPASEGSRDRPHSSRPFPSGAAAAGSNAKEGSSSVAQGQDRGARQQQTMAAEDASSAPAAAAAGSHQQHAVPNYDRKEKNKAAVANHHRKDRAFRKMGL